VYETGVVKPEDEMDLDEDEDEDEDEDGSLLDWEGGTIGENKIK
jgi:hypothetical protein